MIYAITYDLNRGGRYHQNGQDYPGLYNQIESLGLSIHALQNLWLVDTNLNIDNVRDRLRTVTDVNDNVLVVQLFQNTYSGYLPNNVINWLNSRRF